MNEDGEQGQSAFERHLQTVIQGLAVLLLVGAAGMLWNVNSSTIRTETELTSLKVEVSRLRDQMGDRYTSNDAARDQARLGRDIGRLETRLDAVERQLGIRP